MVVLQIVGEDSPQVPLVKNDDLVQAFAADAADQSLGERILPRTARGDEDFLDSHGLDALLEGRAIDVIAIPDQVARRSLPGERLGNLLCGPLCVRMLGDLEVHDAVASLGEHNEDEQDLEGHGGYHSGRGLARCLRFWGVADPAPCRDDAGASFQTGPVDPAPALHTGHGDFLHPALPAEVAEEGYGAPPLGLAARATW